MMWCDRLGSRQIEGALPQWKLDLVDAMESDARTAASAIAVIARGRMAVRGWRAAEIDQTLDQCVDTHGYLWREKEELTGAAGQIYIGHAEANGAHLLWRQNNLEAARANSRLQAARSREKFRAQWNEYSLQYRERFAGEPVGFDRWCRTERAAWVERGAIAIVPNRDRGMRSEVEAAIVDAGVQVR